MISKSVLINVALDYLKAVAKTLEAQIGRNPRYIQRSQWMVRTSPTGMSSQEFTRDTFDVGRASMSYQIEFLHKNPPEQQQLVEVLVNAGIKRQEIHYGFLMPLVHSWLELDDPFSLDEKQTNKVLDTFSNAVLEGLIITKARNVILMLEVKDKPLSLQKGVCIRPISANELWTLGNMSDFQRLFTPSGILSLVSEDWNILDIEIKHKAERQHPPSAISSINRVTLTALTLVSPGHLQVYDLGTTANYGMGASGTTRTGRPIPMEVGRWNSRYVLDKDVSKRLKSLWPYLKKILDSERHYLRIPAQRLVDGGGRYREDDAIIDYAIGLESLLLSGVNVELAYRFALRGAMILSSKHGARGRFFKQLQDFYNIRSKIVHGSHVDHDRLREARSNGEMALRDIWWWYFESKMPLLRALANVDNHITGLD